MWHSGLGIGDPGEAKNTNSANIYTYLENAQVIGIINQLTSHCLEILKIAGNIK